MKHRKYTLSIENKPSSRNTCMMTDEIGSKIEVPSSSILKKNFHYIKSTSSSSSTATETAEMKNIEQTKHYGFNDFTVFSKLSFIPSTIYFALVKPRPSLTSLLSTSSETGLNNRQIDMNGEKEVEYTRSNSCFTGKINTCQQQKAISRQNEKQQNQHSFNQNTTLLLLISLAIFSFLCITPCSSGK